MCSFANCHPYTQEKQCAYEVSSRLSPGRCAASPARHSFLQPHPRPLSHTVLARRVAAISRQGVQKEGRRRVGCAESPTSISLHHCPIQNTSVLRAVVGGCSSGLGCAALCACRRPPRVVVCCWCSMSGDLAAVPVALRYHGFSAHLGRTSESCGDSLATVDADTPNELKNAMFMGKSGFPTAGKSSAPSLCVTSAMNHSALRPPHTRVDQSLVTVVSHRHPHARGLPRSRLRLPARMSAISTSSPALSAHARVRAHATWLH